MKFFAITALLLPAICLAKTATADDMLAQLLSMKASGTKHNAAAEYTYDSSKGAVVSILELVQEMMGDKAAAATKLAKEIADADQKVIDENGKLKTAKTAQTTAQGVFDDAKQDLIDAEGVEGTAKTAAETLKTGQAAAEAAAEKSQTALCSIVTFLCKNTTDATKALCTELTGLCSGGSTGATTSTVGYTLPAAFTEKCRGCRAGQTTTGDGMALEFFNPTKNDKKCLGTTIFGGLACGEMGSELPGDDLSEEDAIKEYLEKPYAQWALDQCAGDSQCVGVNCDKLENPDRLYCVGVKASVEMDMENGYVKTALVDFSTTNKNQFAFLKEANTAI